jgi:hypothetical protein
MSGGDKKTFFEFRDAVAKDIQAQYPRIDYLYIIAQQTIEKYADGYICNTGIKTRIRWTSWGSDIKPPDGQLCRWIMIDALEGLIEIEAISAKGLPSGEWTEQRIMAFRILEQ